MLLPGDGRRRRARRGRPRPVRARRARRRGVVLARRARQHRGRRASPSTAATPTHLLKHAHIALHRAKETRSRREAFKDTDATSFDRLALAAELRRGIERGELVLHYQPKLPLGAAAGRRRGARPLAASAPRPDLARRLHPARRAEQPDRAAHALGARGALRQCAAWRANGLTCTSRSTSPPRACSTATCRDEIAGLLAAAGCRRRPLQLEVTESEADGRLRPGTRGAARAPLARRPRSPSTTSAPATPRSPSSSSSGRRDQDRQVVRHGHGRRTRSNAADRALDDRPRAQPRARGDRRGRRDRARRASCSSELGCDFAQGYLLGRPRSRGRVRARDPPSRVAPALRPRGGTALRAAGDGARPAAGIVA